ncbi:peptide chain release factor N(5)-glutamine methyltransferase [Alcaligenes sp. SDU_A2]|uniref:peptide chain release factor N(5)-glutamine methyltransferase n=1 Tax=Alcaligenes sp. SDU_A2 TaxID=3136634 RepID=UPI00311D932E
MQQAAASGDAADTLRALQAGSSLPRLERDMLWMQVLGVSRSWLIAHDTDRLPEQAVQAYHRLEARRLAGEPMAYIVGMREFMGHDFLVTPDVLIPRPDTETLVEQVLWCLQNMSSPRILDLGCGSGAIAVSLALARPDAQVVATDCSAPALEVARLNAQRLCGKVEFCLGSWYDAVSGQPPFDLIVSNPPYIAADDAHLGQGDVRFEPRHALTDGADGLRDLRTIVQGAGSHLRPGGSLLMEHGWDQADHVQNMLRHAGFTQVASYADLAGIRRVTGGQR